MNKKQTEQLEEYLWKLTKAIGYGVGGLPEDWMQVRVKDLADMFRPIDTQNAVEVSQEELQPKPKERDPLFKRAVKMMKKGDNVVPARTMAQMLKITYARASALIDQLEEAGIISAKEAGKPRKVL